VYRTLTISINIFIGILLLLISGCNELKPPEPVDNDIAKHENILEGFDKMVQSSHNPHVLSFDILPVENKTGSNNEIIDKLKLIPKKELEKMKMVRANDKSSNYIIECVVTQFDSIIKYKRGYGFQSGEDRSANDCGNNVRSQTDKMMLECTLIDKKTGNIAPKLWTSNAMAVTNDQRNKKFYFEFEGSGFGKNQRYIQHDQNISKGLNLLVDVSLIELISKLKNYAESSVKDENQTEEDE